VTPQEQTEPSKQPRAKSDRGRQKTSRLIRLWVLGISLAAITAVGVAHQMSIPVVGVDALCPFGGIETLWSLVTGATFLQRIAASSLVLLIAMVATALVFRRAFCGYLCPLGALQEFSAKLGNLIFRGKRPEMPAWLDKPARWIKYIVLVGFTVWTWQAATLVMRPYDPWVAYMHLTSKELFAELGIGLAVLGVTVVGSVVYDRFFCKYACPTGAFLGAISRLSVFKVRRTESTCTSCGACDKACPVNVSVSTVAVVEDPECINCNECVNVCPVKDTLAVSAPGTVATRKVVSPLAMLGVVVAIMAVTVLGATAMGSFAWTTPTLAATVEKAGGSINVEDIKGSMTFDDISKATGIPEAVFQEKYNLNEADMQTPVKELAGSHGFDVHTSLREFVKMKLEEGAGK
jgi:polyferredoxin